MNCANCQTPLPADAAFCPECGTKVAAVVEPAPVAPVAPAAEGTVFIPDVTVFEQEPAASAPQELTPGSLFDGRYTIEKMLGAGGMGVVYLAQDTKTKDQVAVKLINARAVADPGAFDRLIAEGLTTRNIRHPNIVAVYDVAHSGNQAYMVMEYVAGQSLRDWFNALVTQGTEIAVKTATGIIDAVLDGLKAAHEAGVVHRDLKPDNIILLGNPTEGDFRLRILDFGIAKAVGNTGLAGASALGSPPYMAPEQRTTPESAGPSADIYSISRILYQLLMDALPDGGFQPPSKHRSDIPAGFDDLLEKGLSNRPRSRQQSVGEYRTQMLAAMAGPEPQPEPEPEPETPVDPPVPPKKRKSDSLVNAFVGKGDEEVEIKSPNGEKKTMKRSKLWLLALVGGAIGLIMASEDFWAGFDEGYEGTSSGGTTSSSGGGFGVQTWYDDYGTPYEIILQDGEINGSVSLRGADVELVGTFRNGRLDLTARSEDTGATVGRITGTACNATHIPITYSGRAFGRGTSHFHIGHRSTGENPC